MKVAINDLGRIGPGALRLLRVTAELELLVAHNLVPIENLECLIRYHTGYGRNPNKVDADGDQLTIGEHSFPVYSQKYPSCLGTICPDAVYPSC